VDEKRPFGRPEEYDPKFCDEIVEYMAQGLSKIAAVGKMGFSKTSLWNWSKKYPDFMAALKKGETLGQLWWEEKGAIGMESRSFNAAVWIFSGKNKYGVSDNPVPEQENEDGYPGVRD